MSKMEPSHPHVKDIDPYEPPDVTAAAERAGIEEDQVVRLMANENLFGPPPHVTRALAEFDEYHLHPDYGPLREAVAGYAGVAPRFVVLSNGADELIDLLIRLFVEPGEAVVISPPTFSLYRFYAQVNRCRVLAVRRRDPLLLDAVAIERDVRAARAAHAQGRGDGEPRILFLTSPHNPSGRAIPLPVIERLLDLPLMVVVDEAYIEFGGESAVALLTEHDNLAVLRSFSKWAGMAGLRLGYGLLAPRLAHHMERIRPPYNVNAAALQAALAVLRDLDPVLENVARLVAERERLAQALSRIPWLQPFPTQANFVLCRVVGPEARAVVDQLRERGILVLGFSDSVMAEYVRITVGRPQHNNALIEALHEMDRAWRPR